MRLEICIPYFGFVKFKPLKLILKLPRAAALAESVCIVIYDFSVSAQIRKILFAYHRHRKLVVCRNIACVLLYVAIVGQTARCAYNKLSRVTAYGISDGKLVRQSKIFFKKDFASLFRHTSFLDIRQIYTLPQRKNAQNRLPRINAYIRIKHFLNAHVDL